MKTWEVIKELTENPNKKFQLKGSEKNIIGLNISSNKLAWLDTYSQNVGFTIHKTTLNEEWEEVKEPVSWQEAIQAWIDRKDFKIVMPNGAEYRQRSIFRLGYLENLDGLDKSNFTVDMFINGKFYIED